MLRVILASETPWYSSGTFWAIAAFAVAVVAIPVGAWAAFRSANPRRRLYIGLANTTPLMHGAGKQVEGLEVRHQGNILTDPQLTTVKIISRGWRDIPKAAFDGPIELDFSTEVIALLGSRSKAKPAVVPAPAVRVTSSGLLVEPSLLTRDHQLSYVLLINGEPTLSTRCSLENVDVRLELPNPTQTNKTLNVATYALVVSGSLAAGSITSDQIVPASIALAAALTITAWLVHKIRQK